MHVSGAFAKGRAPIALGSWLDSPAASIVWRSAQERGVWSRHEKDDLPPDLAVGSAAAPEPLWTVHRNEAQWSCDLTCHGDRLSRGHGDDVGRLRCAGDRAGVPLASLLGTVMRQSRRAAQDRSLVA
jgi:hypothetical protein